MKYFGFTCTVGAIAEAVYDAIEPILNELKGDINTMKSKVSSVSGRVDQLTKDVKSIQNGSVSEIADLHSSLHSLMDSMAADRTTVSLSMDHHMDHLKSKISSVEEELAQKLSSLEMKVNSISNSEVMSLGSRLDSLKELISKDISDVFNSFSNDSFAVCDKSEQQETKLLNEREHSSRSFRLHMWRYRRLETCGLSGYDRP